jgi:hypothetical protein
MQCALLPQEIQTIGATDWEFTKLKGALEGMRKQNTSGGFRLPDRRLRQGKFCTVK